MDTFAYELGRLLVKEALLDDEYVPGQEYGLGHASYDVLRNAAKGLGYGAMIGGVPMAVLGGTTGGLKGLALGNETAGADAGLSGMLGGALVGAGSSGLRGAGYVGPVGAGIGGLYGLAQALSRAASSKVHRKKPALPAPAEQESAAQQTEEAT